MPAPVPLMDRIALDLQSGCWNWIGCRNHDGYGKARYRNREIGAHKLAAHLWLQMPLSSTMLVLHNCNNPSCFNPKHLRIGTQSENMRYSVISGTHSQTRKTHCVNGHEFNEINTYRWPGSPLRRQCRACKNIRECARQKLARIQRRGD